MESLMEVVPDRENFLAEMHNYMQAGVVINTPRMFVMAKPVDSSLDPGDQWWVEKPDAWYVRWAAGDGVMQMMMDSGEPLPYLIWRRIKSGATGKFKRYEWNKLYRRITGNAPSNAPGNERSAPGNAPANGSSPGNGSSAG